MEMVREWFGRRMHAWENELAFRSTDRVVRPFDWGLEWTRGWPVSSNASDPAERLRELNRKAIEASGEFFSYTPPRDFRFQNGVLRFTSAVDTPYASNNEVHARFFQAGKRWARGKKAVVVLPHWNSNATQHVALCRGIAELGISALRISLPYHDARMPPELTRADYSVSSNIGRTIDATRQAVIDVRSCFDWLEQEGYTDLGIVGTSLGSCYAFLASAHDARIRTNVFNHCSTYFADVVWTGLSTRHIRQSLEGNVDLETLRSMWLCISPPSYCALYGRQDKRSKLIYTRYDTTFPPHLSEQVVEGARLYGWDYEVTVLPCGHYTLGQFPFKYIAGYEICTFLLRNL